MISHALLLHHLIEKTFRVRGRMSSNDKPVQNNHGVLRVGERVQDHMSGHTICKVIIAASPGTVVTPSFFGEWADGEDPWRYGERYDKRCFRMNQHGTGHEIFVEGEWR